MTCIQRLTFEAAAWTPLPSPYRAIMRATCVVEGDPDALVPDLCTELASALPWAVYGETVIPEDAHPRGTITPSAAEHVAGAIKIETDPNQGAPLWSDGSAEPDTSPVRLVLTQPLTKDLDDLSVYVSRRQDVRRVLHRLTGCIGGPVPVTIPRAFTDGFDLGFL